VVLRKSGIKKNRVGGLLMVDLGMIKKAFGQDASAMKIKVIMIYPNKGLDISSISAKEKKFNVGERAYVVDERAIYYNNKTPVLLYHSDMSSPMIVKVGEVAPSMTPDELKVIIDSKMAKDLITAASGDTDWTFYAAVAAAALSLLSFLVSAGLLDIGGN